MECGTLFNHFEGSIAGTIGDFVLSIEAIDLPFGDIGPAAGDQVQLSDELLQCDGSPWQPDWQALRDLYAA